MKTRSTFSEDKVREAKEGLVSSPMVFFFFLFVFLFFLVFWFFGFLVFWVFGFLVFCFKLFFFSA